MRAAAIGAMQRMVSRAARFTTGEALVLLYHRIAHPPRDPQLLCVQPLNFARHLEVLRSRCRPIPLGELLDGLRRGRLPRRAVALTFDDGYADNLLEAKPLLERAGIPATVFVSTGSIGGTYWWDEVERLILGSTTCAPCVLRIAGRDHRWAFAPTPAGAASEHGGWNATMPATDERQRVYLEVSAALREADARAHEHAMARLVAWAGTATPPDAAFALNRDGIAELARGDLIGIGGHGVSHSRFSALTPEARRDELVQCKSTLEGIVGRTVEHFAFPFGAEGDQPIACGGEARSAGFRSACINHPGVAWIGTDRYRIPRFLVRDWDEAEFAQRLDGWFRGS